MRVSIGKATGYSALEKQKLDRGMVKLAQVLNSREFKDAVLGHTFQGKPGFASDSRTPAEVYAVIRAAKENFTSAADGEVDLNVELKSLSWFQRGVVGYTTPSSDTVTTNRRFYSGFDETDIAGHLGMVYFTQSICTNAALGLIFGRSLAAGREPLCTHLATMVRGPLQPPVARYTRQVTVAWTIFFTAMIAASSLLFILAPVAVWSAFANLLSMPLVAAMFIAEYAVRKRVLPDLPRTHVLESLRAYWSASAVPAAPPGWRRQ